jgi:hypothetical protein
MLTCFAVASAPLRLANPDFDLINAIFDDLGPIPRTDFSEKQRSIYNTALNEALNNLTIDNLRKLSEGGGMVLSMDAVSHILCLIQQLNPTDIRLSYRIEVLPITASIGRRITISIPSLQRRKCQAYCHQRFSDKISITLVSMARIGGLMPFWECVR